MPTHQFSLDLISHQVADAIIQQRAADGYINASQLCDAAGKPWFKYLREENTGNFLRKLAEKEGVKVADLHPEFKDAFGKVAIWVHPQVAIHLGQFLSADFAVKVSSWVVDWINGKQPGGLKPAAMPYHVIRHMANAHKIPPDYFSILQELTMTLVAPMEAQGYTLPPSMVPDISQGQLFCRYARDVLGVDTDSFPTYSHEYPDGRVVQAKLYPVELLGHFRKFISSEWMPKRAGGYFKGRDPNALLALDKVLAVTYNPAQPRPPATRPPMKRAPLAGRPAR